MAAGVGGNVRFSLGLGVFSGVGSGAAGLVTFGIRLATGVASGAAAFESTSSCRGIDEEAGSYSSTYTHVLAIYNPIQAQQMPMQHMT